MYPLVRKWPRNHSLCNRLPARQNRAVEKNNVDDGRKERSDNAVADAAEGLLLLATRGTFQPQPDIDSEDLLMSSQRCSPIPGLTKHHENHLSDGYHNEA